jgi:hypothetical protein
MPHGKWWDQWHNLPVETIMEGGFDRLFDPRQAPPAKFDDGDLEKLGPAMTADIEKLPTAETKADAEGNPGIVAIYPYLGQFIDHDITFDPVSQLRQFVEAVRFLGNVPVTVKCNGEPLRQAAAPGASGWRFDAARASSRSISPIRATSRRSSTESKERCNGKPWQCVAPTCQSGAARPCRHARPRLPDHTGQRGHDLDR